MCIGALNFSIKLYFLGKLFHIDFGYILGRDPKPLPPPMKLSREMVEAMGGIHSEHYQEFRKQCYTAFLHLRRYIFVLYNFAFYIYNFIALIFLIVLIYHYILNLNIIEAFYVKLYHVIHKYNVILKN